MLYHPWCIGYAIWVGSNQGVRMFGLYEINESSDEVA